MISKVRPVCFGGDSPSWAIRVSVTTTRKVALPTLASAPLSWRIRAPPAGISRSSHAQILIDPQQTPLAPSSPLTLYDIKPPKPRLKIARTQPSSFFSAPYRPCFLFLLEFFPNALNPVKGVVEVLVAKSSSDSVDEK